MQSRLRFTNVIIIIIIIIISVLIPISASVSVVLSLAIPFALTKNRIAFGTAAHVAACFRGGAGDRMGEMPGPER